LGAISNLPENWKSIQLLVNNAGLARGLTPLHSGDYRDWEEMIDTNLKGLLWMSEAVLPGMVDRNSGHVIHVGSLAAKEVYPNGNVYCATKHAVDAVAKGMRQDLVSTPIRVSIVQPGLVETEFSQVRFRGNSERAAAVYKGYTPLSAADVAETIGFIASAPAHVNIAEVLILPSAQASSTLVNKNI
jgi:NADP-dependent 3-hydroxy acid dehydrogenase YdfG